MIAERARTFFNVWGEHPEMAWAQKAWEHVEAAGLTSYASDIERTRVLVRLLTLAALYHSWCQAAWEEGSIQLGDWSSDLEVSPFRVAQAVGADFAPELDERDDDLFAAALRALVEGEHDRITQILTKGFGGTTGLFISFWLSRDPNWSGRAVLPEELEWEVVNTQIYSEKRSGHAWVEDGCPFADL